RRLKLETDSAPFRWMMEFSPDGKTLAVGCSKVYLLEAATGKVQHTLSPGAGHATALAFTADGALPALAGEDGPLGLWDVRAGRPAPARRQDGPRVHPGVRPGRQPPRGGGRRLAPAVVGGHARPRAAGGGPPRSAETAPGPQGRGGGAGFRRGRQTAGRRLGR